MTDQTTAPRRSTGSRLLSIARTLWPAAFVFIAFDLAVSPDVSIMRSALNPSDAGASGLHVVSLDRVHDGLPATDLAGETADSDHLWFGVEEAVERLSESGSADLAHLGGGWSGQFASMLEGDVESGCWSPYEVNIRLREKDGKIFGPGSYVVDPSVCSGSDESVVAFFNASGERNGDQVSLVLVDDASDKTTMLFNGVIAGQHIVGTFSMPNGAPASGTTVLTLVDAEA